MRVESMNKPLERRGDLNGVWLRGPGSVLQAPSGIFRIRQGCASHTFKEKFPPLPRLAEEHLLSV